jgi:ABC-type sugar transport system ATPase subunit
VETPLLEMRNIRKSFALGEMLHGLDFTLRAGESHAIAGHNRTGKSTLIGSVLKPNLACLSVPRDAL